MNIKTSVIKSLFILISYAPCALVSSSKLENQKPSPSSSAVIKFHNSVQKQNRQLKNEFNKITQTQFNTDSTWNHNIYNIPNTNDFTSSQIHFIFIKATRHFSFSMPLNIDRKFNSLDDDFFISPNRHNLRKNSKATSNKIIINTIQSENSFHSMLMIKPLDLDVETLFSSNIYRNNYLNISDYFK